jgi:hypothetical protein
MKVSCIGRHHRSEASRISVLPALRRSWLWLHCERCQHRCHSVECWRLERVCCKCCGVLINFASVHREQNIENADVLLI